MTSLGTRLTHADRATLLRFLIQLVTQLTIRARAHYDSPESHARLMETNEAIHRVAGHLRDLLNFEEPMTESRAEAVAAQADLLVASELERLVALTGV